MKPGNSKAIFDFLDFLVAKKNENNVTSYISIKNVLYSFSIPFAFIVIPKGTPLFRLRVHDKFTENLEEVLFYEIKEIGHRYDNNRITCFGRANEPLQSIFYCSTERELAFFETSQLSRGKEEKLGEIYTTGKWILQEDIKVATFPINEINRSKNEIAEKLNKRFEELVNELKEEGTDELLKVLDLISLEFAREYNGNSNNYLISAAFSNYIYDHIVINMNTGEEMNVDGIIYPSVQWTKNGMNLALKPELIKNKILLLDQAVCQKSELTGKKSYMETDTIISKSIDYNNWKIIWK